MEINVYRSACGIYGFVYYVSAMTMRFSGKKTQDSEIFLQSQWLQNLKRDGRRFDKAELLLEAAVNYFKPEIIATIPSHLAYADDADPTREGHKRPVKNIVTRLADKYNPNPIVRKENCKTSKYNQTGVRNGVKAEAFNPDKLDWDWEAMRGKRIMLFDDLSKSGETMHAFRKHILSVLPDADIVCFVLALGWKMVQHKQPQDAFAKGEADAYKDISNRIIEDTIDVPGMSFALAGLKDKPEDGGKINKFEDAREGFLTRMAEISAFRVDGKIINRHVACYAAYVEFIKEFQYVPNAKELYKYSDIPYRICLEFLAKANAQTLRQAFEKLKPMIDSVALSMVDMATRGSVKAAEFIANGLAGKLDEEGGSSIDALEIVVKGRKSTPFERGDAVLPSHVFVKLTNNETYEIHEIDLRGEVRKSEMVDGTYNTRAEAWEALKRAYADFNMMIDEDRRTLYRGGEL